MNRTGAVDDDDSCLLQFGDVGRGRLLVVASTLVELMMLVTCTPLPPSCSARVPHWLMEETTEIAPCAEPAPFCDVPQADAEVRRPTEASTAIAILA